MITKLELCRYVNYDPDTGYFTWVGSGKNHVAGERAGHNQNGYVVIFLDGRSYPAHRLAWLWMMGMFPPGQLDHANRQRDDNRWCNLRGATPVLNAANRTKSHMNTSGFKGVSFDKRTAKWRARLRFGGCNRSLGYFISKAEACEVYRRVSHEIFGEYARAE